MPMKLWAGDFQFQRRHPAQTVTQSRRPRRNHSSVGNDDNVAPKRLSIFSQEISEVAAADLFFAFNDEMKIHRQVLCLFNRFLNAEDVRKNLALVVRR